MQQAPVTIVAPIAPGKLADLETAIGVVNKRADSKNAKVIYWEYDPKVQARFRDYFKQWDKDKPHVDKYKPHVHFARCFILYANKDKSDDGQNSPGELIYLASVDGTRANHLHRLRRADGGTPLLDGLYAHCSGFPENCDSAAYFVEHGSTPQAFYVNKPGRTVSQVKDDAKLRNTIVKFVDEQDWFGKSSRKIRSDIQQHVRAVLGLQPDPEPEPEPGFLRRILRGTGRLVGGGLKRVGIAVVDAASRLSPRLNPGNHGMSDEIGQLTPLQLEQLESLDDHGAVQSPFFAAGRIKGGGLLPVGDQPDLPDRGCRRAASFRFGQPGRDQDDSLRALDDHGGEQPVGFCE